MLLTRFLSQALLEIPPKVSRCATVLEFFSPNSLDAKPPTVEERLEQMGITHCAFLFRVWVLFLCLDRLHARSHITLQPSVP